MFNQILARVDLFFLLTVRILAMLETAPLVSGDSVPQFAKIGLAFGTAMAVLPYAQSLGYAMPQSAVLYLAYIVGEAAIGIISGFFLTVLYSSFITAGQFFSIQMGFGISETYDPLAQMEIPIVGQLLNLIGMFVFIQVQGFQYLFLYGVKGSFKALTVSSMLERHTNFSDYFIKALASLFANSFVIAVPIIGSLFMVSIAMGLLTRAAPQMNLLIEGFPISIFVSFLIMALTMPYIIEVFSKLIDAGFYQLGILLEGKTA